MVCLYGPYEKAKAETEIRMPRKRTTGIKIIFNNFILIPVKRTVTGIISIVTTTATYLEYRIGCENKEIIIAIVRVPIKINNDNHRAMRYSANDFLKLNNIDKTIRAYIKIDKYLEYGVVQNCSVNGIVKQETIVGRLTSGAQKALCTLLTWTINMESHGRNRMEDIINTIR
jgi:hypothetical protein